MRFIKAVILAMTLTLVFVMPAMADETTDAAVVAQEIATVRSMEVFGMITLDARIFDLTTELQIHKLKAEPNSTFVTAAQGLMLPMSDMSKLSLDGRKFNCIALLSMYGFTSDDEAISQLQELRLAQ